jgi:hypothetical protein
MPPSEPSPPEKMAEAPFDNPRADLILRSSDEVHFRVIKGILSIASPVLADMFSIPSPPSEKQNDEIQVVSLSEDSTVLDVALRHIYPVRSPEGDTLLYASILTEFARKYQVEALNASITVYLKDSIERDPVGVYAIAVTYGYDSIGGNAAQSCLSLPFSGLRSPYLRCATTELELLKYHVACGEAASTVASSNLEWLQVLTLDGNGTFASQLRNSSQGCGTCWTRELIAHTERTRRSGPLCLWDYLYRSALVLAHHPTAEQITTEAFVLKTNDCHACASSIRKDMLEVSVVLKREIENAIERVSLCLQCSVMRAHRTHICQVPLPKALSMMGPSTTFNAATN